MNEHRVAVTVSYGDLFDENYIESTHMLSYDEAHLSAEEAVALKELIIMCVLAIRKQHLPVLGVYKTENLPTETRH